MVPSLNPPTTDAVILGAVRTPLGAVRGSLAESHPTELLGLLLRELARRCAVTPADVGEVVAGCVEQVGGQGGNVARGAVLAAGWPATVGGSTVDRGTTSGLCALATARALVTSGVTPLAVAATVDVPSVVPPGAAAMGRHPYGRPWGTLPSRQPLVPPGVAAERLGVARSEQDRWAATSVERALDAVGTGSFDAEIVATSRLGADELPTTRSTDVVALAALPPALDPAGTVTAGNSAPLADGAVALLVADARWAADRGLAALATIRGLRLAAGAPDDLASAALDAARPLLHAAHGRPSSVELAESTAALTITLQRGLGFDPAFVNPAGGALALGEAPGASDLRSLVTLVQRIGRGEASDGLCVAAGLGVGAAVLVTS